jgi:hypothetical protein
MVVAVHHLLMSPQRVYWWRKRLQAAEAPSAPSFIEVKLPLMGAAGA